MSPLFGSRLTMFVHDEFIGESPEEQAPAAAERLSEVMAAGMKLYLPDIPVKCAPVLMRRWYKEAEPVWDDAGNLLVWEPSEKA
jgi:DNA polymerase I-like protein with 3'-5' exonuclease and polymerase domains